MEKIAVDRIEVKRCFVISQLVRKQRFKKSFIGLLSLSARKRALGNISDDHFKAKLKLAKEEVFAMPEKELDKLIKKEYKKRLVAINNCNWYMGEFTPKEAGVWRRAGGLPLEWTNDSLLETAECVKNAIEKGSKKFKSRASKAIPNILKINVNKIQEEKYLLPIIYKGGTGTRGRRRLKRKMKYDIDDGCMRSIALTIYGAKSIKAYVGFPKK